jgi:biopolymer transport protein ExbD
MSLRKRTKRSHGGSMAELNITPLLDLVFVLLVIFIITTPQLMNNLEINLPSPKPPPPQKQKPKINRIMVNNQSQITLNDEVVTLPQLKDKLAALQMGNPDLAVVVKGDDNVPYQIMVNILDTLQDLNIQKVGMATE